MSHWLPSRRAGSPRFLRKSLSLAVFSTLVGLGVAGCGPRGACPAYPHSSPEAALEAHRLARETTRVIRAEARVETRGREGRVRGTVLMFLERPDRVRFDVMTQFGAAAILTSDGERFQLMDLRENRYLVGPACPANIGRLLGVELEGAEVARFLMGDTPRLPDSEAELVCEGEGYRVTLRSATGERQELTFFVPAADSEVPPAQQRLRLRRSELFDPAGESAWRVTYEDYQEVAGSEGVELPFVIHFEDHRNGADTLVRFRDIAMNVEVPAGAFEQSPPGAITPEYVSCE